MQSRAYTRLYMAHTMPLASERSNQNGLGLSAQMSAKEKNRQAQRRFRERQKDLIANLKQRVEDLQSRVAESEKEIIALKEENAMLRGRIEGKQQGPSVTLPAETLQSLLQMTGASGLLADAPRPRSGGSGGASIVAGSNGGSAAAVYGPIRGGDMNTRGGDAGVRGSDTGRRGDLGLRRASS
ncbi:hypothetical protein VOLCADRAFT_103787 [Volvox carteri f. nagariensis]|uniref:BZIP domain-containing protein n=1 Tax=Volvox carteri f. nagariensis TaxID=3068 RepID=D8TP80_VOLCA|nr:uncharacterized protein VOLCADRAFT_103787 [Volvox carteri f. nagariensis]EFJ50716.1 hypothetical protein VOLCADRAFT_103787 [Volvox carteri f. nagariensis]|eukprot:XP_002948309.1 hypothetical protein VOLCADRAFT_103787 [Volvox carteri f. nagariensis]